MNSVPIKLQYAGTSVLSFYTVYPYGFYEMWNYPPDWPLINPSTIDTPAPSASFS